MKLVKLIKMCPNETYSRFLLGKHLSDMFPIRNVMKHTYYKENNKSFGSR